MYNKRTIGSEHEKIAEAYLTDLGYQIIEHNFYCRTGEIDMIAKDKEYLVFVEVKYRSSTELGYPEEAITKRKQRSIIKAAKYYMLKNGLGEDTPCRFDVLVILGTDISLISNAFDVY